MLRLDDACPAVSAGGLLRIEIWLDAEDFTALASLFQCVRFLAGRHADELIFEMRMNVVFGVLIERQLTASEFAQLLWGEGRNDQTICDVHAKLVTAQAARCVAREASIEAILE